MNVRSADGERRHRLRQQERRKALRWKKAWAGLDDPLSLLFDAELLDQPPITLLPLPLLKSRIQELNIAMELAAFGTDCEAIPAQDVGPLVRPAAPVVAKRRDALALQAFERLHERGIREYQILVRRGLLAPAVGEGWALLRHADLEDALPEFPLKPSRRRLRYLVQVLHGVDRRIVAIRVYSVRYTPIIERRFK